MYTIREGKITETDREDLKSHETPFDNRIEAVRYMIKTGNTHNFTKDDHAISEYLRMESKHSLGDKIVELYTEMNALQNESEFFGDGGNPEADFKRSNQADWKLKDTEDQFSIAVSVALDRGLELEDYITSKYSKLFTKELEELGDKKGYQLVKEHDSSYTIISNKSLEEIKNNVHERDIFKTLKSLEDLNSHERKISELRHHGEMNHLESFKHTADKELERSYGKITELSKEKEFYLDPQRGNDPERAKHISSELHKKENQFKDLLELSKNYGVKIENTHQELDREIRLREKTNIQEKPGAENQGKSQAVRQSKTAAPGMKIDLEKTAKQFRSRDAAKQPVQKSKGRER